MTERARKVKQGGALEYIPRPVQWLLAVLLFGYIGFQFSHIRYVAMNPEEAKAEVERLAKAKAKRAADAVRREKLRGNPECWEGGDFTYARCCDLDKGNHGDEACWSDDFGYGECCDPHDAKDKAEALLESAQAHLKRARWLYATKTKREAVDAALKDANRALALQPMNEMCRIAVNHIKDVIKKIWEKPDPEKEKSSRNTAAPPDLPSLPFRPAHEVLGVAEDATDKQLKQAYRKLSRKLHPDKNPTDPMANARFAELSTAYKTLTEDAEFVH